MGSVADLVEAARRGVARPSSLSPLAGDWSHGLFAASLGGRAVVVQVYASAGRDEPVREWEALTALDGTGLAPVPIGASLGGGPPVVVMSRVSGRARPLGALRPAELDVLAEAHRRVHTVRPLSDRPATGASAVLLDRAAAALRRCVPETGHGGPRNAISEALAWVEAARAGPADVACGPVVYGRGDPNGANYLWSGGRVTLVDFEDAGTTDPATELGDLVEHAANRGLSGAAVARLAAGWDVDRPALLRARRIVACFWLGLLAERELHGLPIRQVGAGEQAERVLALLAAGGVDRAGVDDSGGVDGAGVDGVGRAGRPGGQAESSQCSGTATGVAPGRGSAG